MSWTRLTSISVTNGSAIVTVNSGSTINIKVGGALLIGGFDLVEIEGVFANQLQLGSNWNHATQSNVAAAIVPTFGDFNHAVEEIRKLRQATTDNLDAMEQWWTKPEGSVVFQSYDGKQFEARSVQQMEKDVAEIEERAESMMTDINAWGFARTEADMIADRARNNQLFAASGAIHHGKHRNDVNPLYGRPIQDGLWTYHNFPNTLRWGAYQGLTSVEGDSETYEAVLNMAGFTVHLKGMNYDYENAQLILPPAPKGTEVYDSSTGVLTNFETDVDPKYGDVAADTNEAVARAFEGMAKNGNFREGLANWQSIGTLVSNEVQLAATQHLEQAIAVTAGVSYVISAIVKDVTGSLNYLQFRNAANNSSQASLFMLTDGKYKLTVTPTENGYLRIYSGAESTCTISSLSMLPVSKEVVTCPVDLVGLEGFLRPITEADPFLYPYGMQQSKLTYADGIATVENNTRVITHFEVYPGDTTSRGRGWNLLDGSLSDAQIAKIFQNPEHNIYRMSDGTLVQWTVSRRTIRGAGNGDWINISSTFNNSGYGSLQFSGAPQKRVHARGNRDVNTQWTGVTAYHYRTSTSYEEGNTKYLGVFTPQSPSLSDLGVNGECCFYVVATVPRLNQGAYHPSLNPFGTALVMSSISNNGAHHWYHNNAQDLSTSSQCFDLGSLPQVIGEHYAWADSGSRASGVSGHPDGLYHDSIYASGLNGVIDQRLKYGAWDASSSEQAAVVREEVKNGAYRGREKLKATIPYDNGGSLVVTAANPTHSYFGGISFVAAGFKAGDPVVLYQPSTDLFFYGAISKNVAYVVLSPNSEDYGKKAGEVTNVITGLALNSPVILLVRTDSDVTVEGEFASQTVYAHPSDVLAINALRYGWLGLWGGIPADSKIPLGRPLTNSVAMNYSKSTDKGDSWTSGTGVVKNAANETNIALGAGAVYVFPYKALANPTILSTNIAVHHAESGLPKFVDVFSSADVNYGAHLGYSLFNFTLKGSDPDTARQRLALTEVSIDYQGVLSSGDNGLQCQKHAPVGVLDSSNDTPACKVMMHQTSKSGLASLNIVANELRFDAVSASWSDNSKMKVKNGIFTDLANASCLAVIHELSNPYGFIKNRN